MKKILENAENLEWVDGPYPRSKMKVFPSEGESGTYTILLKLPAGGVLEQHVEPLNEVFYILKGSARFDGKEFGEGVTKNIGPPIIVPPDASELDDGGQFGYSVAGGGQ